MWNVTYNGEAKTHEVGGQVFKQGSVVATQDADLATYLSSRQGFVVRKVESSTSSPSRPKKEATAKGRRPREKAKAKAAASSSGAAPKDDLGVDSLD